MILTKYGVIGYPHMWIQGYRDKWIQGYRDTGIQGYSDTVIQWYMYTWIHGYMDTGIQWYMYTGIQGYSDTCIHGYRDTVIHVYMYTWIHRYRGGHVSHWGRPVYRVHREGTGTRVQLSPDPEKTPFVRTEVGPICPDCSWPWHQIFLKFVRILVSSLVSHVKL